VLLVTLDDLCGGLGNATAAALAAHAPLRQVALPDGSVAARLPLRVLRSDDVRVRAAAAAWDTPFGWLRAPAARLLLVGGEVGEHELSGRVLMSARLAIDAAESSRTPWALLHVVCTPERDDEAALTEALRGWFPAERLARVALAPSGAPGAGAAALDARLGDCLRSALAWRCAAFRKELARLDTEVAPSALLSPSASAALKSEYAAGVAEGLAALLEAAAWHAPALEACDALAARLALGRNGLLADLPPGGDAAGSEAPSLLVDAVVGAPAAAPTGRLTRLELRERVFARVARLLRGQGQHEELGRRGVAFVRAVAAELAVGGAAQQPVRSFAAADHSDAALRRRRAAHAWATAAGLQLAGMLQAAYREALASAHAAGAETTSGVLLARAQTLSRVVGEVHALSLTHVRSLADAARVAAGVATLDTSVLSYARACAPLDAELPLDGDVTRLLQRALASGAALDALSLRLSAAAASALLAGGRPRAAGAVDAAAGVLLLTHEGARRQGCSLLMDRCRALAAEGWHALAGAHLPVLLAASELAAERAEAAVLLLSLPANCCASGACSAALGALGDLPRLAEGALDGSSLLAVSLPRGAAALQVVPGVVDEAAVLLDVELWSVAPAALELRDASLQLVCAPLPHAAPAAPVVVTCVGPRVLRVAAGCNVLQFSVPTRDVLPGEYGLGALTAHLGANTVVAQPLRWSPAAAATCASERWARLVPPTCAGLPLIAPAAGGPGQRAPVAMIVAALTSQLSLLLLPPRDALLLGSSALQWVGVRVRAGGSAVRAAALALSGGPGIDVPAHQDALLRVRSGYQPAGAWSWQRVVMDESTLSLPPIPPDGSVVVWVRVHARGHAPMRAADAGDAVITAAAGPLAGYAPLRLGAVVRHIGHGGAAHMFATSLTVPATAPFRAITAVKYMPGSLAAMSSRAALHACISSQLVVPLTLRSVALRPATSSHAACGRAECTCQQVQSASPLLALPAELQPGGEIAALFLLQPCAGAPSGALEVQFHVGARREQRHFGAAGGEALADHDADDEDEADGGASVLPTDEAPGATQHDCCLLLRLADAPSVRVAAMAPQFGRVGESVLVSWRVQRVPVLPHPDAGGPQAERIGGATHMPASSLFEQLDAAPSSCDAVSGAAGKSGQNPHGEAPAYEADDERDEPSDSADTPQQTRSCAARAAWALCWDVRAPLSRWLILGAREGVLRLNGDGEAEAVVTVECVPVAAGDVPAPALSLRWQASGASVRGMCEDPPAAPLVCVLPACA
jgi:hypothetical protein